MAVSLILVIYRLTLKAIIKDGKETTDNMTLSIYKVFMWRLVFGPFFPLVVSILVINLPLMLLCTVASIIATNGRYTTKCISVRF